MSAPSVEGVAPVPAAVPATAPSGRLSSLPRVAESADTAVQAAELQRVATQLQQHYAATDSHLNFSVDPALGVIVVTVTDAQNGKVLRQIPSEEALRIARFIDSGRSALIEARA